MKRDASFYRHPDVNVTKRYHACNSYGAALCGLPMLNEETATDNPPETAKCKRCVKSLASNGVNSEDPQ
jgi:hypothetical protein